MTGPIIIFLLFNSILMLRGKVEYGNSYGFGLSGSLFICMLINLLTKKAIYVELYTTFSVLGYSLLPFVFLAAGSLAFTLHANAVGLAIALAVVTWATISATRMFEYCFDMQD